MQDKDVLPSWQEGKAKQAIIDFVQRVTDDKSDCYVALEDRIATFDNDGTLWVEKPVLTQLEFFKDALFGENEARNNSGWFKLIRFIKRVLWDTAHFFKVILALLHSGLTTDEYRAKVSDWIEVAKHPRYKCLYTDLAYLPMLELLLYLEQHGFKNYIVSGGTSSFIRPWSQRIYRISADRIIGSSLRTKLSEKGEQLVVKLEPIPFFFDNRSHKVLGIERALAKKPIAAFGNSLGDVEMLRWAGQQPTTLCMLIHHTDEVREYKYSPDPSYHFGKKTLTWAQELDWQVVDMKNDWKQIFKFESKES